MTNTQANLITLKIIEKKNINYSDSSKEIVAAEVIKSFGQFNNGYIVIASVTEDEAFEGSLALVNQNSIMAVVASSLNQYM